MSNKPFSSRKQVLALRKQYDAGTIIELIGIQMRWRRGSRLALIPGVDSFRNIGHKGHIYSCDEKTATDSFDSCESIGCIKGNAVVLFVGNFLHVYAWLCSLQVDM